MTWSLHQYQMLEMASPKIIPDQGRSDSPGTEDLSRCIASPGTAPHSSVPLGSLLARIWASARKYLSTRPS